MVRTTSILSVFSCCNWIVHSKTIDERTCRWKKANSLMIATMIFDGKFINWNQNNRRNLKRFRTSEVNSQSYAERENVWILMIRYRFLRLNKCLILHLIKICWIESLFLLSASVFSLLPNVKNTRFIVRSSSLFSLQWTSGVLIGRLETISVDFSSVEHICECLLSSEESSIIGLLHLFFCATISRCRKIIFYILSTIY